MGARNRLQGKFLAALADDFNLHSTQAIVEMRERDPSGYTRAIVSLMPNRVEVKGPRHDFTDGELEATIAIKGPSWTRRQGTRQMLSTDH